jgi:hypothetical protein
MAHPHAVPHCTQRAAVPAMNISHQTQAKDGKHRWPCGGFPTCCALWSSMSTWVRSCGCRCAVPHGLTCSFLTSVVNSLTCRKGFDAKHVQHAARV